MRTSIGKGSKKSGKRRESTAMIPASLNSVLPGVVEEAAVPLFVVPPGGGMEETRSGAIKAVQAILSVLGGVAVDDIQQHHDAQ